MANGNDEISTWVAIGGLFVALVAPLIAFVRQRAEIRRLQNQVGLLDQDCKKFNNFFAIDTLRQSQWAEKHAELTGKFWLSRSACTR